MAYAHGVQAGINRVEELAQQRRLPRLGRIRLGERRLFRRGGKSVQVPVELAHFRFDAESLDRYPLIRELYGDKPARLDVMLPVEDPRLFFPQACKLYGREGNLKCKGDGRRAARLLCGKCGEMSCDCHNAERSLVERECPCELLERRECRYIGSLMVMLPRVTCAGVWQIDTASAQAISSLNSDIAYVRSLCGRVAHVPLTLRRVPRGTAQAKEGRGAPVSSRQARHTLKLTFDLSLEQLQRINGGGFTTEHTEGTEKGVSG